MEKNSSEADLSVSTSSRLASRRIIRQLDGLSVSKFISDGRWTVFLTKSPHERDWFLYFRNISIYQYKYLDELVVKIRFRIYA